MSVGGWSCINITHSQENNTFKKTGENTAANYLGLKTAPMKYLPAKSDHADSDCTAVVAFLTLQSHFHTEEAEEVSQRGNARTWVVSSWRLQRRHHASIAAGGMTWQRKSEWFSASWHFLNTFLLAYFAWHTFNAHIFVLV